MNNGDALRIGVDDVRRMVAAAFPQWADLSVTAPVAFGTDHLLFRLGPDKLLRIPSNPDAARAVAGQAELLAGFAHLPLAVPRVLGIGEPSASSPYPWTVFEWIEGADASQTKPANWRAAAQTLGRFVSALRSCDPAGGRLSGRDNALRGAPLAALDGWMRPAIAAISDNYDPGLLTALWDAALAAPVWTGRPVWVHGDLHAGNLIVRDGHLAGVIDFGLVSLGDPACDLAPAWTFLPASFRAAFRDAAGLDDAAWLRGRGWALYAGAIALAHHKSDNRMLSAMGHQAITAVLDSG